MQKIILVNDGDMDIQVEHILPSEKTTTIVKAGAHDYFFICPVPKDTKIVITLKEIKEDGKKESEVL